MSDPLEALDSLLTHPGWLLVTAHLDREWGPGGVRYTSEMDRALDLTDNAASASQARQIRAAQRVILALKDWPAEEVARLRRQTPVAAGMSRRGGL